MDYIDLRSDTVTRPSREMLTAMVSAEVGDDVFGEDPTTNRLQQRVAEMFGKEAALFVASGTMGNEICIKVHTQPGDEILVEENSHVFVYEVASPSFLAGVQMKTIPGQKGVITVDQIERSIRPSLYYMPSTSLICLENTHGRTAGSVVPLGAIKEIFEFSRDARIAVHIDGARIWNAHVASGISLKEYGKYADSFSCCFSKGLGAPIGSIIVGSVQFVERAKKFRKIFGGGMRQTGILAAAANYALDNNVARLKDDHAKAKSFAAELAKNPGLEIDPNELDTNMVFVDIKKTGKSQMEVITALKENGVLVVPERQSHLRAVMHLDVSAEQVMRAAGIFSDLFA